MALPRKTTTVPRICSKRVRRTLTAAAARAREAGRKADAERITETLSGVRALG